MVKRRDDKVLQQIADRIRKLRKIRDLSQAAVFEDTGVNVGNIETKPFNMTITTIVVLCDYFEVTLEEFFKGIVTDGQI